MGPMQWLKNVNKQHYFNGYLFVLSAALPLYVVRWSYLGKFPTTLLELLIWGLLLSWLVWRFIEKNWSLPEIPFGKLGVWWLAVSCVALLMSDYWWSGLGIARAYFWEPFLVAWVIGDLKKSFSRHMINESILYGLLTAAGWVSIIGIAQGLLGIWIVTPHQADRAHGVFNNGNALALFLGPVMAMIVGRLPSLVPYKKYQTYFYGFILFLAMGAFQLADSLGGNLALLATFMALSGVVLTQKFSWANSFLKKIMFAVVVGSILVSVGLLVYSNQVAPHSDNPWVRSEGTSSIRVCLWQGTYRLLQNNWVLGVGLSDFKEVYSTSYITCDAEPLEYPHNLFMTVWTELGLFGVFAFAFILISSIKKASFSEYKLSLYLFLIYFLVHGLVDVAYFKNDVSLQFWLLLSLL